MKFLAYLFWNFRPLKNKREISVVGWSGCELSITMEHVGEGMNAVKNSGYLPACSAVVMLKIEARSVCNSATAANKTK